MRVRGIRRSLPCACTLIVAAFHAHLAGAVVISEDVPVPGGTEALARSLAITPVPDRARFILEATRLVYESGEIRSPAVAAFMLAVRQSLRNRTAGFMKPGGADVVPVPLNADLWSDAVFKRRVTREELVLAIVADKQAAWLCHGLARLDDETLEFVAARPALLTRLYERSAPLFAAFAESLRIDDNRVVPPGGPDAAPLWEAVLGEKVTRADRFLTTLFETSDGRIAYIYDTIGRLDAPHRAFALGSWLPEGASRQDRFRALVAATTSGLREWHARVLPFNRSSYDLGMALARIQVDPAGAPAPPTSRSLWSRVFGSTEAGSDEGSIDAAWLAENIVTTDVRQRGERLDQLGLAQRVFPSYDGDRAELVFVLRALPRFRALQLTFERMGVRSVATYAAVLRHTTRLAALEGRRGYVAHAQLQGVIALLARMTISGTLEAGAADRLVQDLVAVPVTDSGYAGGVARWIRERLHPLMPAASDFETAVVAGLAGPPPPANTPRVVWEGQPYRLDLPAAERNRLQRIREKQRATALDIPMQMAEAARTLATETISTEELEDVTTQFAALANELPQRSRDEEADNVPSGVAPPPAANEILRKAASELSRAIKNKDLKRVTRLADPVVELADDVLARSLLSLAYAISIGDPEGTVLLADDVSHRHDFGFGLKDADMRARVTWSIPRQEVAPGISWHVSGSLLGLDVGLATLSLRRVATDHILEAPKLTTNARDTFATSVSLMDPRALRDADRDAIADAIDRGVRRASAVTDPRELDTIAAELGLERPRTRAMRWTLKHEPGRVVEMLSLTELLALGGGRPGELHAWGMAVIPASGCFCPRLLPTASWPVLDGRPQLGLTASVVPDLNFRVAIVLKELGLPAALAKVVLSAAMQDFIDEARPTDDSDWLSLSRIARAVTRERIEDYVAAATATGPLIPETPRSPEPQR